MSFEKILKNKACEANDIISAYLPKDDKAPGSLIEAMNYSILAGGKRIRPILMRECYEIFGGSGKEIGAFMAAMEIIHTSSLVHDDLPAIDNDLLRRGKKTTHAAFGEALGVLAGDALINYAYELLIETAMKADDKAPVLKAAGIISEKSGYRGMIGGQAADVENEKSGIDRDKETLLNYIYEYKTAALFAASMMSGAALAGADDKYLSLLEKISIHAGIAFQITDDILDVTGTAETIGKPVYSDEKNKKDTYVSLKGVEKASEKARELTGEALMLLNELPADTGFLKQIILYLVSREK